MKRPAFHLHHLAPEEGGGEGSMMLWEGATFRGRGRWAGVHTRGADVEGREQGKGKFMTHQCDGVQPP